MNPLHCRCKSLTLPVVLLLVVNMGACRPGSRAEERLAEDSATIQQIENQLTFNNITLEQADEQGKLLWKVDAQQATYNEDQEIAQVTNPQGELYEEGRPVYKVRAKRGEVQQNGDKIFLYEEIVAVDLESKAVFQGDELEWRPNEGVLIVRKNLKGAHPDLRASANEARLYQKERRVELIGKVTALSADPRLLLQAQRLTWLMDAKRVVSDRPVQVTQFKGDRVSDVALGQQATVDLNSRIVTLRQNAQVLLSNPIMQINSDEIVWNLGQEVVSSDQPVRVIQQQQQVVLTANSGRFNQRQNLVTLRGNVQAFAQRDQSQLKANTLTWNVVSREIVAEGNVDYRQVDPPLVVNGPRAVGRLESQTIVVSGGRVVTEIVPE